MPLAESPRTEEVLTESKGGVKPTTDGTAAVHPIPTSISKIVNIWRGVLFLKAFPGREALPPVRCGHAACAGPSCDLLSFCIIIFESLVGCAINIYSVRLHSYCTGHP